MEEKNERILQEMFPDFNQFFKDLTLEDNNENENNEGQNQKDSVIDENNIGESGLLLQSVLSEKEMYQLYRYVVTLFAYI